MSSPENLGRLRRVRRIGVGGFASVWLYHDTELDSPVAVKALADNWAQRADVRERFLKEAQLLRATDSAHVVQVYDIGETDDHTPYFVMTYADHGTVTDLIREGTSQLGTTIDLIAQAAQGIADLHATGVIHRDIKPSNLLLRSDRNRGKRLLVTDLGVAKAAMYASGMTQIVGTPAYMAPEQAEPGSRLDARADVHGLGAVAYHLLTGRVIREGTLYGRDDAELPEAPSEVADLPRSTDAVLLRAVAIDPADRWPDPVSFAAALRDAVSSVDSASWRPAAMDRTIGVASSPGPRTPPLKRGRRKAWLATGLAAGATLAVVVAGYLLWPWGDDNGAGSEPDGYCTVLREDWDRLAAIGGAGSELGDYAVMTDAVHRIRTAAPTDVEQRWAAVDDPLQDFRAVLEERDVSWQDLQDNDLDPAETETVSVAASRLSERLGMVDLNAIASVDTRSRCGFVPQSLDLG